MLYSFIGFLLLFMAFGIFSYRYSQPTTEDYLLAGFSFFATENSGLMFIGFIGMIYTIGVSAAWLIIGWYLGEIFALWRKSSSARGFM